MFEGLKKTLMDRIEDNAVKSVLDDREVYLKKSRFFGEWAEIHPPVNEDGSWNLKNLIFGGSPNLVKLIIMLGIAGLFLFALYEANLNIVALMDNPCVKSCLMRS